MSTSMAENFQRYFTVKYAATPELKQEVFRTRFSVYCREFGYEPLDSFPDEMEHDDFDDVSLHCLIQHNETGMPAGCVRLVPASFNSKSADMPFERYCMESLDHAFIESLNLQRDHECEISRLAVDGAFRRRQSESLDRYGNANGLKFGEEEQRVFPLIAVSAFLAATSLTLQTNRPNAFAMMEPFLPRLLARSGLLFERAGQDIDYHGIRAPYFITAQSALQNMRPELKELFDAIHERITVEFKQAHAQG